MEIREEHAAVFGIVDVAEALTEQWRDHANRLDVVRVMKPSRDDWPALAALGFVPKPDFVSWTAETQPTEQEFLARLTKAERGNIRTALRQLRSHDLTIAVEAPVTEPTLDTFLAIYQANLARHRNRILVAVAQRDAILADPEHYYGVFVYRDATLVAGSLCFMVPAEQAVRIRFSAVDPAWRAADLTRAMYLHALRVARERSYPLVSLGGEPNLYGHIVQPGLFSFKARFGFSVVSSQEYPGHGADEADLILSLRRLNDPSLILAYPDPGADPVGSRLVPQVFSRDPALDLRPYQTRSTEPPSLRRVAGD
ncbi:MAG TPA: GNAT family N-acetyltransferase [Natronosporangium sp.]